MNEKDKLTKSEELTKDILRMNILIPICVILYAYSQDRMDFGIILLAIAAVNTMTLIKKDKKETKTKEVKQ